VFCAKRLAEITNERKSRVCFMMLSLDQLTISFVFNGAFFMVSAQNWLQGGHKKASTNLELLHLNMQKFSKKLGDFFVNAR
jgi:hypothetical protein